MADVNTIFIAKNAAPLVNPTVATMFTVTDAISHPTLAAQIAIPEYDGYPASNAISTPANTINAPAGVQMYELRVKGRVSPGTSGTFGVSLMLGNSTTYASNTVIYAPAAATYAVAGHWFLDMMLIYDPISLKLDAMLAAGAQGSTFAVVAQNAISALTVNLLGQKQYISVAGIFGTSNAGNIAYLDELILDAF